MQTEIETETSSYRGYMLYGDAKYKDQFRVASERIDKLITYEQKSAENQKSAAANFTQTTILSTIAFIIAIVSFKYDFKTDIVSSKSNECHSTWRFNNRKVSSKNKR